MASTIWRGYITFGLVSIPVRLFKAARPERIPLRRVARTSNVQNGSNVQESSSDEESEAPEPSAPLLKSGRQSGGQSTGIALAPKAEVLAPPMPFSEPLLSRVRQVSVNPDSGTTVLPSSVVKGYEFEKNRFVEIDRETLKNIAPKTSTEMQIQEFVSLAEVDPVFLETSYYVVPEEPAEKSYALLYAAMKKTDLVALAQFAMHGREHLVMIRPGFKGLLAHTMFYASEVRGDEEYRAQPDLVGSKELELAQMLVESLTATFEPEKYKDGYREKLEALIAEKVGNLEAAKPQPPTRKSAAVFDIADALRKSLSNLQANQPTKQETRKPVTSEAKAGRTRPKAKGAT